MSCRVVSARKYNATPWMILTRVSSTLMTNPSSRSREISTSLRFAAFGFAASSGAEAKGLAFLAGGDTTAWYVGPCRMGSQT